MLQSSALEAEYALDERSPLTLYDCLVPKLYEHRQLTTAHQSSKGLDLNHCRAIADKSQQKSWCILTLEKTKRKKQELKSKVFQLKRENDIIKWLTRVTES